MARLQRSAGERLLSHGIWSTHLLQGRPERRLHWLLGGRPSNRAMWQFSAPLWAGASSCNLATWPKRELWRRLIAWFLRSGKLGEFKSTRMQKLTKMRKKIWTVVCRLRITVENFSSSLRSQIICTCTFKFVLPPLFLVWLQVVESQH